ncbi:MAG: hypothetical protein ACOX61_09745 [Brooklawnia sp.]|jgi:hypothetical protein
MTDPPQAPAPPQAPTPPRPAAPPTPPRINRILDTDDPRRLARRLVDHMKNKKTELDLSVIPDSLLPKIEQALITELDAKERARYGYELRRLIRFTIAERAGLVAPPTAKPFKVDSMGTERKPAVKVKYGQVRMHLDGKLAGTDPGSAFILVFDGNTTGVHWLQFMWRQIIAHYPATGKRKARQVSLQKRYTFKTPTRVVLYSENAKQPRWSTDGTNPNSPFYDTVTRQSGRLELKDAPSSTAEAVRDLFSSPTPPSQCVSIFGAAAYLVKDREVLYRADLTRSWTITKTSTGLVSKGGKWSGRGKATSKIDPVHRATLAKQFPRWDYLPGDLIAPPVMLPDFHPIPLTHPDVVNWPDAAPLEQMRAAAKAANAKLIEDVEEHPDTEVLTIHNGAKKPGLSYFPNLRGRNTNLVGGETGYIDQAGAYHNPAMPHVRGNAPPRVTMIMGADAFGWGAQTAGGALPNKRDKLFTLAVAHHEMRHGVHARFAIEWLMRWRDELTREDFTSWMNRQLSEKRLTPLEHDLVLSGVDSRNIGVTEILSSTEGLVTALAVLPASPTLAALSEKGVWPASLLELDGLIRQISYYGASTKLVEARDARLRQVICGELEDAQRAVVAKWMDFLANVDPKQADPTERDTAKLVKAVFGSNRQLLLGIKKIADSC